MDSEAFLESARLSYHPRLPELFKNFNNLTCAEDIHSSEKLPDAKLIDSFPSTYQKPKLGFVSGGESKKRPLRVGIVLSGGQAPGGHNVITGLYDALQKIHPESKAFGFLNGPEGIVNNQYIELEPRLLSGFRNTGGFHLLGSGRTKIETVEQFEAACKTVKALQLDGLVIVGGDDSNTNAAFLAEYFVRHQISTGVIGVPKTIDGDLKNKNIEISFGFDTACKIYSELIGNLQNDALSAQKYYFFIKLMGRSASHIALECALQTHPNLTFIGEEIKAKGMTIRDLTSQIADLICNRALKGKNYGVILFPEGLIEFIPECNLLIRELNKLLSVGSSAEKELDKLNTPLEKISYILKQLTPFSAQCLESLPKEIQNQLLLDRDPHGNVQVSKIETERLFLSTVSKELKIRKKNGSFAGKFNPQPLFYGYEGRSGFPSNFDAQYCYTLGHVAALLIANNANGYMAVVKNLAKPVEQWQAAGIPLVSMMHHEQRGGKLKPVIAKSLVDLAGKPFNLFKAQRENWMIEDHYRSPGPIQFFGPAEITESVTITLKESCNGKVSSAYP